jgi:cellulose synthase/poly-beta-1,6-N-acetylglucosamine synthase-like glycosyltransferase
VFKKIGLFRHAHNTEDMEIAFRMHANHLKIVNAHTAYVYTTVPNTIRALIRQRTRWSQGFLQNSRDYAYMYFNRNYGHFGTLILPFGFIGFMAALYTTFYAVYQAGTFVLTRAFDYTTTGIPLGIPNPQFDWFFITTDTMLFVMGTVLGFTLLAIYLGSRIAQVELGPKSFISYILLYGFIAPFWLVRAAWGAALARESVWR